MVQTGGVSGAAAYAAYTACGGSGGLHETQTVEAYVDMNWRRFQQLGLAPQEHTEIKSYVVQVSTFCYIFFLSRLFHVTPCHFLRIRSVRQEK